MRFKRPPILPTILMLLGVGILCTLGTWQIQRLAWKNDLISQLDQSYADKKQNPTVLDLSTASTDSYDYGRVHGVIIQNSPFTMANTRYKDEVLSKNVVIALRVKNRPLWVDLGWNADTNALDFLNGLDHKKIWIDGLVWQPKWNSFTPENKPDKDQWYKLDITQISEFKNLKKPYPFILRAENTSMTLAEEFEYHTRPDPNNNHLQYALFWFSMAGVLMVIYALRFLIQKTG